nr:pentatricopeptide repeat-containing protein [Tanacetum cinerariifolium]
MFIEFVIQNQFFSYSLEEFAQILDIPCEGACVFTDKWSLDELAYGVPMDGPYQTNPPSSDDIILSIRIDREAFGRDYPGKCFLSGERKTRKDHSMKRGHHSTSSSYAFDQPSSSHLNDDDVGNDEGTSHASTLSPIRFVNYLTNEVPQNGCGGGVVSMEVVMVFVAWRGDEGGSGVMRCAMMLMAWIWWPAASSRKLAGY